EEHGEREGFLPGGAARAPDADRIVAALAGGDGRDDLAREHLPRLGIPEEGGDVDEDGVEELAELLRVHLEIVAVIGERRDIHLLQPPADAAAERGPLVAAEVEAPAVA